MRQRKEARAVRGGKGAMDVGADVNVTEGDWQGRKKGMGSVERRERQRKGEKLSRSAVEKRAEWWSMLAAL